MVLLLPEDTSFRWSVIFRPPPPEAYCSPEFHHFVRRPELVRTPSAICSSRLSRQPPQRHLPYRERQRRSPTSPVTCGTVRPTICRMPRTVMVWNDFRPNRRAQFRPDRSLLLVFRGVHRHDPRLHSDPERWQHSGDRIPKSPACWDRREPFCCLLDQVRVFGKHKGFLPREEEKSWSL